MVNDVLSKKRALVVDDEPLVSAAVCMLLEFDGYDVEKAGDGQGALAKAADAKFDLILVDYDMPGMKGDELAANLRQRLPQIPIIMLTAHGEMLRATAQPIAGIDLIVDKPFRLEILRASVARAFSMHAAA